MTVHEFISKCIRCARKELLTHKSWPICYQPVAIVHVYGCSTLDVTVYVYVCVGASACLLEMYIIATNSDKSLIVGDSFLSACYCMWKVMCSLYFCLLPTVCLIYLIYTCSYFARDHCLRCTCVCALVHSVCC